MKKIQSVLEQFEGGITMRKPEHVRPEDLVKEQAIFARRGGDRELDRITAEQDVRVQADVRGQCFKLVDTVARRFAPEGYRQLYQPFDGFTGFTDPSADCLRDYLIDPKHIMPHRLWNEFCRRYTERVHTSPTALWDAGRLINDLDQWGPAENLKRGAGQFLDIRMGIRGIPPGNFAFNLNKFWKVHEFWTEGGCDYVRLTVQIRNTEMGLDHNIDCWSFHFWWAIASAVPRIWGRPHAEVHFRKIQFDMKPYLQHFQERARFHQLDCLQKDFGILNDKLIVDGKVVGMVIGTNDRNRPIVRITQTVHYAGPINLLNEGEEYGHDEFEMIYRWTPIPLSDRLRRIWDKGVARWWPSKSNRATGYEFQAQSASILYAVSQRELELVEVQINQERLAALDEMRRLKKAAMDDRLRQAVSIAREYETWDGYTNNHVDSVRMLALLLAQLLGITEREALVILGYGAYLHDLGKRRIPKNILGKPGRFTPAEFDVVKRHTEYGDEMARESDFHENICDMIRHHHEHLDGSGYPDGLKGDAIKLAVRIVQICDIFNALTMKRPYPKEDGRDCWPAGEALQFMKDHFVDKDKMDRDLFELAASCFPETVEIA
ncbi:HD domain-containing protein [Candidatus Berkelbacteria bacterium]|nr:HD domain-containing protein [Candidatus Berkelbacteria bacterium]